MITRVRNNGYLWEGQAFGWGQRWDWGFLLYAFSQSHSDVGGPGQCVPCSLCSPTPTPLSDLYHEGWTPCSHIKTLCIPHLELPLAHSLGFRVYQWVLCSAKGRTTQVKALGVGRDCLGRDSQGFSSLGSVDSLLLDGCSRKRPAAGTLKCKDVMPFRTFYFQIMWMCVFFQWIGGVQK